MSPTFQRNASQIATADAAGATVWVVDDSALEREVCCGALTPRWTVRAFSSGAAMIEALADQLPQVIVLDWHMPDLSGVEVCQFVRSQYDLGKLPILILTATPSKDSVLKALAAGANDFVAKPISDLELNARVAGLVRMSSLYAKLAETERTLRVEADFRERFMGMLAHDLRQPLNTIFLASQALAGPASVKGVSAHSVGLLQRAGERMRRMINDLLDFTRARPESGMPIQREPADLAQIVRTAVDEQRLARPDQVISLQSGERCHGCWDADRLAQVCSNLLGNALEHGAPGGPIDVQLTCSESDVELTVSNRGEIIPADVLSTLFQPFRRGRDVRRTSGGVGLGLYIVAQIVRAHGGTCSVQSDETGTHFRVRLPSEASESPVSVAPSRLVSS
jgi:signal transduction histidine kinase